MIRKVCLTIIISIFTVSLSAERGGWPWNSRLAADREGVDFSSSLLPADGVYTGTADGFRPGLTAQVVATDRRVAEARILSHDEKGSRYYLPPMETIPPQIVAEQSTRIDAVSGATATSHGIFAAAEQALGLE